MSSGKRERTLLIAKADAVQRGLVAKIIVMMEKKGFKLVAMEMMKPPRATFEEHYAEHKGKPFFDGLVDSAIEAPCVPMVWEGDDIIATSRKFIGATDPAKAAPGTIRGDHGLSMRRNSVHGSDSVESAEREIAIWFPQQAKITTYANVSEPWVYERAPVVEQDKKADAPEEKKEEVKKSDAQAEKKEEVKKEDALIETKQEVKKDDAPSGDKAKDKETDALIEKKEEEQGSGFGMKLAAGAAAVGLIAAGVAAFVLKRRA